MGFYIATSDATGARIADSALLLQPGPTRIDYPQEPAGTLIETDDGSVIHQQPNKDGRRRQWSWVGYPAQQAGYQRIWPLLESLRSRYRFTAGLCPYVYLREDVTGGVRRRLTLAATGSATGFVCTASGTPFTGLTLAGGFLVIGGQSRAILSNTASTVSVGDAFVGTPSGATVVSYWTPDWFRARVLEVSRKPNDDGRSLRYEDSRIVFVVDDPDDDSLLG